MKEALKFWWMFLLKGIVLILLAFYVFRHPVGALVGLALYIGIATLVTGIILLLATAAGPRDENWGWRIAEGIIDIIFGLILLSNPAVTATVLPFVVGFWIMFSGVLAFVGSFSRKKEGDSTWWVNLLTGLLGIVIGYVITNNLFAGAVAITYWMGFGFLIAGVFNLAVALKMRKVGKAIPE